MCIRDRLLMKKQVTDKENRARAGGIRDSAAFVRSPKSARAAGARFRRCLYEVLRQPDVLEEMIGVVETLGTEACAVPEVAVAKGRQALCLEYGVALDEGLGQGSCGDERSRYFSNLWEKLLAEAADPESKDPLGSVVEWMRTGALIGWRKELRACGVFPQTWEDTAAVEKSKMYDSEALEASFANYRSFLEAGEHSRAEVKRIHEAGFTRAYHSLDELKQELGQDVVINNLGCMLKTKTSGEVKARLVTDLRRSGGNGRLKIRERMV